MICRKNQGFLVAQAQKLGARDDRALLEHSSGNKIRNKSWRILDMACFLKHTASFYCGNLACSSEDSLTPGPLR